MVPVIPCDTTRCQTVVTNRATNAFPSAGDSPGRCRAPFFPFGTDRETRKVSECFGFEETASGEEDILGLSSK